MAGETTVPTPPPAAPPTTGPTATWGTQHFDKAPTAEELRRAQEATSQSRSESPAAPGAPSPQQPSQPAPQSVSVTEAVKTIKAGDFLNVYQVPCARQGFLTGIGGGAVVGMLRYILGANIPKSANWAVGAFAVGGIVSFEACQALRRAERAKMKRVVEVYDRKQAELQQRKADKLRQQKEKEEQEAAERAKKSWYRFW